MNGPAFCEFLALVTGVAIWAALPTFGALRPAPQFASTVYVNRYFEVRDHAQPTKYVFTGDQRVAAVTGSLSANPRVQRLRLYAGWNLCSMAVTGPFSGPGTDAVSAAYRWDPASLNYSSVAVGQTLAAGTILWIKAGSNAVVSLAGSYADPVARQAQPGGAYLPGAGLEAWLPVLPDSAAAWEFDPQTAQWSDSLTGLLAGVSSPLTTLSPGQAFFLQTPSPVSLEVPDPSLRIRYYHQDHLGSASVLTDGAGALVEESAFLPFGFPRHQSQPRQIREPYEFTQKERDTESDLQYFEARFLDPACARFLKPDPKYANPDQLDNPALAAFLAAPQELNLYAYVNNSPLIHTDPTGLGWWSDFRKNVWVPFVDPTSELDVVRTVALGNEKKAQRYNEDIDEVKGWFGKAKSKLVGGPSMFDIIKKQLDAQRKQQTDAAQKPGGGPPVDSTEAQQKVLSLLADLVKGVDDILEDGHTAQTTSHSQKPREVPPVKPAPARDRGAKAQKDLPIETLDMSFSKISNTYTP